MALLPDVGTVPDRAPARSGRSSNPTLRYAVNRTLAALSTLVFVVLFNFFLFRVMPGDPISLYTRGRNLDQSQLQALRANLNKPLFEQLIEYLKNPLSSGVDSIRFNAPVWEVIGPRVYPTLLLVGTATIIATVVGVWLGIRSGWNRGGRFDKTSTTTTLVLYSMPEFWFGMIMLIVFSVWLGWFPVGGLTTPGVDLGTPAGLLDLAWHLVLPVTTLAVIYFAEYSLIMRASIIEERSQDYLQTARAKGLMDSMVRRRHAVPNALLPTMTLVFLNLGFVVGGAITIEYVYSIDGLDRKSVV